MQQLRTHLKTYGTWWLSSLLGVLVVLNLVQLFQVPAPPAQRQAATPEATAATPLTLRWNYALAAPERFVIRRSIDGGTWQDVAVLPGASGMGLTWEDTTLPTSSAPVTVKYTVYAVVGSVWSEASNVAVMTMGLIEPVNLGDCVLTQPQKKQILIRCKLP